MSIASSGVKSPCRSSPVRCHDWGDGLSQNNPECDRTDTLLLHCPVLHINFYSGITVALAGARSDSTSHRSDEMPRYAVTRTFVGAGIVTHREQQQSNQENRSHAA